MYRQIDRSQTLILYVQIDRQISNFNIIFIDQGYKIDGEDTQYELPCTKAK